MPSPGPDTPQVVVEDPRLIGHMLQCHGLMSLPSLTTLDVHQPEIPNFKI